MSCFSDSPESGADRSLKLDTEAVISEVIKLIWRLEADRQEAEEALKLERKRKQGLLRQIDVLSLWKLQNLPKAVQKGTMSYFFLMAIVITIH